MSDFQLEKNPGEKDHENNGSGHPGDSTGAEVKGIPEERGDNWFHFMLKDDASSQQYEVYTEYFVPIQFQPADGYPPDAG